MNQLLADLNDEQLEAATSTDRTILCLAGAGAGKTKTMISRIVRQVDEGVDPKSILALTFTNAAAFEMKERYKKVPGIDLLKGVPEFRTFHSFCYSLIVKDPNVRERLGYTKIPELCDDSMLKDIKERVKLQIGCTLSDAVLENDVVLSKKDQESKNIFLKAVAKQLKKDNLITFDIMCYNVCEMFVQKLDCIEKYRQKYTYIYCDEFQDTDPRQYKFVSSFPETTNFYLVADALQCIYQFRNCTNTYVKTLAKAPGWKVIKLHKNYRSVNKICDFANNFSRYAPDEYRIKMEGQRDGGSVEQIYGSFSSYNEPVDTDHLKILIEKLKENKSESAILCRSNKECAAVREALKEANIDYASNSKPKDTIDYLDAAVSNDYLLEWLSSMLEARDYGDYLRTSALVDNPDIKWFLANYGRVEKVKTHSNKVAEIRKVCSDNMLHPMEKFEKITKLLRVKSKCKFEGNEFTKNEEIISSIRSQIEEQQETRIYVGTIHSAKGLEYDTVYVMGVNDRLFELGSEEMNNLYYVAITRAKNHLTVFRR